VSQKNCPLYTKTFGGKIGKNLHSVSHDNIFGKKFKMACLKIFRQKYTNTTSCEKSSVTYKKNVQFFLNSNLDEISISQTVEFLARNGVYILYDGQHAKKNLVFLYGNISTAG